MQSRPVGKLATTSGDTWNTGQVLGQNFAKQKYMYS